MRLRIVLVAALVAAAVLAGCGTWQTTVPFVAGRTVASADTVYVASHYRPLRIRALDADLGGVQRWRRTISAADAWSEDFSFAATSAGLLVAYHDRAGDEHLTLLDARTGNARWVSTTGVWEIADEVVPGIVVFYPDEWGLALVDLATGAIVDSADVHWYRIDGRLYALDGTTLRPYDPFGTTTATTASTVDLGSNPGRLLGGSAGRLFLADGTTMRALDTTGATMWTASLPLPSSIAWTRPLGGDRLLVIDDIFDPSGLDAVVVDAATGSVVPGRLPDTLRLDEAVTTTRGSSTYLVGLTDPNPTIDPAGDTSVLVAVDSAAPEVAVTASRTVPAGAGVRRLGPGEVVVESDFDQLSVLDAATLQPSTPTTPTSRTALTSSCSSPRTRGRRPSRSTADPGCTHPGPPTDIPVIRAPRRQVVGQRIVAECRNDVRLWCASGPGGT